MRAGGAAGVACLSAALGAMALSACRPGSPPPPAPAVEDVLPAAAAPGVTSGKTVRDGLVFELELRGEAARGADVHLRVSDATTGEPVRGLALLGWLDPVKEEAADGTKDDACRDRIRGHMSGLISAQADVSLAGYLALALAEDATVSIVDPTVAFSRTRMKGIASLPGAPSAIAVGRERAFLVVENRDLVSVMSPTRSRVERNLSIEGACTVAASPDGDWVFVGTGGDSIHLLDAQGARLGELDVGKGPHRIGFDRTGRVGWILAEGDRRVVAVDPATRATLHEIPLPVKATRFVVSGPTGVAWAVDEKSGALVAISLGDGSVRELPALPAGIAALGVDGTGRWLFAAHREGGAVTVVDGATGRRVATVEGLSRPDALAFTDRYAYVRQAGRPELALISLGTLGAAEPTVSRIAMGQRAPGPVTAELPALVPTPEGDGVLVASPEDRAVFFYREGMMAPVGAHQSGGRKTHAVLLFDRTLRERAPGEYVAPAGLLSGGLWELAVLVESPRVGACVRVERPGPAREQTVRRLEITPLFDRERSLAAGERATLELEVKDVAAGTPVGPEELDARVVQLPGTWSQRPAVTQTGRGTVRLSFVPPRAGQLQLVLAAPARGVPFSAQPPMTLKVRRASEEAR